MRWMLDTDTCIAVIKKNPQVLKKLRGKSVGQVGISSITLGELSFGAEKSSRSKEAHEALADFLVALEVSGFDDASAMTYGRVRASLAQKGQPIGPLDTLIGSHALEIDVVLVSHNTLEFSRIEGLRLEDWTEG
jgi:tRNA(fMet)-specific endonuclease VapC